MYSAFHTLPNNYIPESSQRLPNPQLLPNHWHIPAPHLFPPPMAFPRGPQFNGQMLPYARIPQLSPFPPMTLAQYQIQMGMMVAAMQQYNAALIHSGIFTPLSIPRGPHPGPYQGAYHPGRWRQHNTGTQTNYQHKPASQSMTTNGGHAMPHHKGVGKTARRRKFAGPPSGMSTKRHTGRKSKKKEAEKRISDKLGQYVVGNDVERPWETVQVNPQPTNNIVASTSPNNLTLVPSAST